MAEQDVKLMKGNEAIAHATIRCGADGYFGYPISLKALGDNGYGCSSG